MFTPVLLALAEDEEPGVRWRGLELLALFIAKCPGHLLWSTGIGSVFEQVAFPALLHLPSITPEDESVQLLDPAYQVLLNLANSWRDPKDPRRRRLLDKILRDGIFEGYHHASQHARVALTLLQHVTSIINSLGIYSIKHLQVHDIPLSQALWHITNLPPIKKLLAMLSVAMTDPFAMANPPAVFAAAKALNVLIVTCWPRFLESPNAEQVIRTTSLCWLSLRGEDKATGPPHDDTTAISRELMQAAKMLQSIWSQHGIPPPEKLAEVLKQEPYLVLLFTPAPTQVVRNPV